MSREYILEAAAQVFRQKGFHGASMADIADAVNLKKASLYHHFGSKQEILLELLETALAMVIHNMEQVMAQDITAAEKLRLAMRAYLNSLSVRGDLVSVLLLEYRSLDPEAYSRHIANRDRFEQMWRDLLQQGVQDGEFHCESIPMTVRGVLGTLNWAVTWYRPDGRMPIESIADHYAHLFLEGLRPRQVN